MKSCPACSRTYEDTLTYCLIDGSILSAPFDPHRTQRISDARRTDPAPTEVWPTPTPTQPPPPQPFTGPVRQPPSPIYQQPQVGYVYPKPPVKRFSLMGWMPLILWILWIIAMGLRVGGGAAHILLLAAIVILVINLVRRNLGRR